MRGYDLQRMMSLCMSKLKSLKFLFWLYKSMCSAMTLSITWWRSILLTSISDLPFLLNTKALAVDELPANCNEHTIASRLSGSRLCYRYSIARSRTKASCDSKSS